MLDQAVLDQVSGIAPDELEEWYESLEDILHRYGEEKLRELLVHLRRRIIRRREERESTPQCFRTMMVLDRYGLPTMRGST